MDRTLSITEVSRRSGFAPPTLRYYEQIGLLRPARRTEAGYRIYDESILDQLALVATAKTVGCSLQEIAELMPSWYDGRCAPVQDRLRGLTAAKREEARQRIDALEAFRASLEPLADLVRLVAAEQSCCQFFEFAITVDGRGLGLDVRAPAEGQPIVHSLFGAA